MFDCELNNKNTIGRFMLQKQSSSKLSELQDFFKTNSSVTNKISTVFKGFTVCKSLKNINLYKQKGYEATDALYALLLLPFILEKSIYGMIKSSLGFISNMEKDVFYRLKNNPSIDWRRVVFSIIKRSQKIIQEQSVAPDQEPDDIIPQVKCLVFDDTVLSKTGYKIEGIGKIYDHVCSQYLLGFKMLCCCFWDGKSLNPLDFSLHSEKGKQKKGKPFRAYGLSKIKLNKRYRKKREVSRPGWKRKNELSHSKIKITLEMMKRAVKQGFIPDYVLLDKWFVSEKILKSVRSLKKGKVHVVAACKKDKRKYTYKNKLYTASELLANHKDRKKHCRSLKTLYIGIIAEYKGVPIKLFFNKPSRRKNWELLVTTDLKLSFINALKIYRIRWGIEVFFKECKQYLLLGKCQSQDFDAQIADITLSLIRYIILNHCKRFQSYETLGEIFRDTRIFTLEFTLGQRIWFLFLEVCHQICEIFEMDEDLFMQKIISMPKFGESVFVFFNSWNNSQNQELKDF